MLGQHGLLERHLRKSGKTAIATVIECRQTHWAVGSGNPDLIAGNKLVWKLKLRVEPDGEPAFEARTDEAFGQLSSPEVGMTAPVLYDPSDHTKVMIDNSDAAQEALVSAQRNERLQGQIDRARAAGSAGAADGLQQLKDSGLLANYSRDPAKAKEQREQIKKMMLDAQAAHGMPPSTLSVAGQPVYSGRQGAPSTADELAKLAALRDRGVLTEAEFEGQKQKLLS